MITLYRCAGCGHMVFPKRQLCSRCGGAAWASVPCRDAVIETVTTLHRGEDFPGPVPLACARTQSGVRIIVRLQHAAVPGDQVSLHETGDRAVWAREIAD